MWPVGWGSSGQLKGLKFLLSWGDPWFHSGSGAWMSVVQLWPHLDSGASRSLGSCRPFEGLLQESLALCPAEPYTILEVSANRN
jgi:hypothetical protein